MNPPWPIPPDVHELVAVPFVIEHQHRFDVSMTGFESGIFSQDFFDNGSVLI